MHLISMAATGLCLEFDVLAVVSSSTVVSNLFGIFNWRRAAAIASDSSGVDGCVDGLLRLFGVAGFGSLLSSLIALISSSFGVFADGVTTFDGGCGAGPFLITFRSFSASLSVRSTTVCLLLSLLAAATGIFSFESRDEEIFAGST